MRHQILLAATLLTVPALASPHPVEVGPVDWARDLDAALAESARSGKPVFAFFQEVPGCAGCQRFGRQVMSHPPIVEAVEAEFVPLLIHNNKKGADARALERFGEPSWNYQVVRFLDAEGRDLIERKDRVWTRGPLASRMIAALDAAGRAVPAYLETVVHESEAEVVQTAAFAQACFWSGEVALGQIPGVVTTEAGWIGGREVTLVQYVPRLVSLDALTARARAAGVADAVFVGSELDDYRRSSESDQKRQIRGTPFAELELSPMQATKVNAFATVDIPATLEWMTPSQRARLTELAPRR